MDSEDSTESQGVEKWIRVAEQLWKSMNCFIETQMSNLNDPQMEESLRSVLHSILYDAQTVDLKYGFMPPNINGQAFEELDRKYTAFSIWLFGALFNIVGSKLNNDTIQQSVELQARMLRILSRFNLPLHVQITKRYIKILQALIDVKEQNTTFVISEFNAGQNVIPDLKLTFYPVEVNPDKVSFIQVWILQIILKSDISVWNQLELWNTIITILATSDFEVKDCSLEILVSLIQLCYESSAQRKFMEDTVIGYSKQIIHLLPTCDVSSATMSHYTEIFIQLIKSFNLSTTLVDLSFVIIDAIANGHFNSYDLQQTACCKIKDYLHQHPGFCDSSNNEKYVSYCKICDNFVEVLIHYILYDVESMNTHGSVVFVSEVSSLWVELRKTLKSKIYLKNFHESLSITKAIGLLNVWFQERNITTQFFESDDMNFILENLMTSINSENKEMHNLIFENFIELMNFDETTNVKIQHILSLIWTEDSKILSKFDSHFILAAKTLSISTKAKCLKALCRMSDVKPYLPSLNFYVSNTETKLTAVGILCSPILLFNGNMSLVELLKNWIQPIYETKNLDFHQVIASILGHLICLSSGCGTLVRVSWDSRELVIECKYCDKNKNPNVFYENIVPNTIEKLIVPYFQLLRSDSHEVRIHMAKNLLRFSNHTQVFNSNSVTSLWLFYVGDEDINIRNNVTSAIGFILQNKMNMLQVNDMMLESNVPDDLNKFVDLVIERLVDVLVEVFDTFNDSLHSTLLATAKAFAWIRLHLTEKRILTMFLHTILHPASSYTAVNDATNAYRKIVEEVQDITPRDMYIRYKTDFLETIVEMAVFNYVNYSFNMASSIHRTAKCIGYQGSRQFLTKDARYVICFLVSYIIKVPTTIKLLSDMADLTCMKESDLIANNFDMLYTHLMLNETPENASKGIKLTEEITNCSSKNLIQSSYTGILSQFILHFSENTMKVIDCLKTILEINGHENTFRDSREYVKNNVKSSLHGILVSLDKTLRSRSDMYIQKCALASLATLINFMGSKYITPFRYMILIILRTSLELKRPGFKKLCCDAFNAFIHNTTIADLGPLLPTICVSMIPLLKHCPRQTNAVLEYLIVQNNQAISTYIPELFFIKDLDISTDIADRVTSHIRQARPRSIEKNLEMWLKRIKHETEEVRLKALAHLKTFLANHRCEINELIIENIVVHPLVVELLDTLLAGCQDKDEAIRLASGECIGELGAVEPSLLPRRIISRDDSKFIPAMNEQFAGAALVELYRSLQMEKSTISDTFSLAIQEILKPFDISPTGKNSALWSSFPPTMQQIIHPFLTSRYTSIAVNDSNKFPHPIYGSQAGSTFESWAYNWVCSLSKSVRDTVLQTMLTNCKLAFQHDIRIATFFLPYVVAHIITSGMTIESNKIIEEMLTVIKGNEKPTVDEKLFNYLPIYHELNMRNESVRVSDETRRVRCSQVVFSTIDHLHRWLREERLRKDEAYSAVKSFCDRLNFLTLAQGSYQSYEYHRSLLYLEQHVASSNKGLSGSVEGALLAKIYTQLEEPDGVSGILAIQDQCPTLQQLVLAHEVSGQMQDAATCYEMLVKCKLPDMKYLQGMIQCYLKLNQPFTAMNITKGVLNNRPELEPLLVENEPFWKLASYGMLDDASENCIKNTILNDLKNNVKPDLLSVKKKLVSLVRSSSYPGAYLESYSYIMKLHVLNEFEKAIAIMLDNVENVSMIFDEWEKRGQLVRATSGQEFVLSMRRATLDLALKLEEEKNNTDSGILKEEIGKLWLKSARIARKAGLYQQAYGYILSATGSCAPQDLYIEQAKLYWQKGCQEEAITTLKQCLSNNFKPVSYYKEMSSDMNLEEKKQCAKAKLLFAKYNDETLNVDMRCNIINYTETLDVWQGWEKSLVAIGQYYESVVDKFSLDDRDTEGRSFQENVIYFYGKSLQYGCKYIHQSMPRMLTIWIDYAVRITRPDRSDVDRMRTLSKMTKNIEIYVQRLPAFMWLTAFSQIVSRICLPIEEVQNVLSSILVKVILAYPQQSMWMIAYVYNSSSSAIHRRCKEIFSDNSLKTSEMMKLIKDFHRLWETMIELSNKKVPDGSHTTQVKTLSPKLPRLLSSPDFSPIMMPTTKFRQLHLPAKSTSISNHKPFVESWVQITGIKDVVVVISSLQRPRRICFLGSDGKEYRFMCKPKDDLRKDFRLMEFNDVVNKYLQKDSESCRRRLYIRTYSVVPLNEECGLIEWVPNLVGLRPVLINLYKERKLPISLSELKPFICDVNEPLTKKRQIFLEKLLPRHPPVLGDWFRITFPDAYGWYEARTAYIRTTAVMSMVGYILGLGDRHGENINIDSKCGDCVHVDFNCLFNNGERFPCPERVPFRLTHNMIDAMGPLKYEGPFRKSCETTMRVLREQTRTLMSVLTPFVYNPLVEWIKRHDDGEKTNKMAIHNIKNIEQRLKGFIKTKSKSMEKIPLHLSVEGQVNHLILEATNVDNLCQMYIGWGPFL